MKMKKVFYTRIGILPIAITSVLVILLLGLSLKLNKGLAVIVVFALISGILFASYFFPIKFIIARDQLIIQRLWSKKIILLNSIRAVSKTQKGYSFYSPSSMNAFNTRGFFGYLGKTPEGNISYATAMRNNIWIKTGNNKQLLISVKKPKAFIKALNSKILEN